MRTIASEIRVFGLGTWQMDEDKHVPIMAYSPIEQAGLFSDRTRARFARQSGMTPAQAAFAWLLIIDDVITVPTLRRTLDENLPTPEHTLTREHSAGLDRLSPSLATPSASRNALMFKRPNLISHA
jgi:diketogulonate reductase-like aldo/keto reductase